MSDAPLKAYKVWDRPTRIFHGVNLLSVFLLIVLGTLILNSGSFGIQGAGKVLLKEVHTLVGYVFVINLVFRLVWGFIGNRYAKYGALLPTGKTELKKYLEANKAGKPRNYLGHNPLARIGLTLLIVMLIVQAITGLLLAGTDIYYPPLGGYFAEMVAAEGVDPATLIGGQREFVDAAAYAEMREIRAPFYATHEYMFYALCVVIFAHIFMAIRTDNKYGGTLISALFTGKKHYSEAPVDADKD